MKSRLTLLAVIALFMSACTTGSYVSSNYTDDIYFNPSDVPPPISVDEEELVTQEEVAEEKSGERMIISKIEENEEGSQTMNNYIFEGTEEDADALSYSMDQMDMYESDTTVYYNDDEMKYVINNYYDGDAIDYAYRIRRFHRPHFYDSFYWDSWYYDPYFYDPYYYSSWYYPSWSYSWNWGWGRSWYSPYSYGWGYGYSPYYSYWHRPYYGWGYNSYYGGYYAGYYNGFYNRTRFYDSDDYRYGKRRTTGTNVLRGSGERRSTTSSARASSTTTKSGREGNTTVDRSHSSRRNSSSSGVR